MMLHASVCTVCSKHTASFHVLFCHLDITMIGQYGLPGWQARAAEPPPPPPLLPS